MPPVSTTSLEQMTLPPQDSETLYEIVDGEIREIPHMGAYAGLLASILVRILGQYAEQNKLGVVVMEVLFRLRHDLPARRPDIAFVSSANWKASNLGQDDPPEWKIAPDLSIEVISPSNTANEIEDKLRDYFAAGVQLVWVIHPRHRRVYVYESPIKARILSEMDELDGGGVLPGFKVRLASLFTATLPPQ